MVDGSAKQIGGVVGWFSKAQFPPYQIDFQPPYQIDSQKGIYMKPEN